MDWSRFVHGGRVVSSDPGKGGFEKNAQTMLKLLDLKRPLTAN
jgi:hypothetical protein